MLRTRKPRGSVPREGGGERALDYVQAGRCRRPSTTCTPRSLFPYAVYGELAELVEYGQPVPVSSSATVRFPEVSVD